MTPESGRTMHATNNRTLSASFMNRLIAGRKLHGMKTASVIRRLACLAFALVPAVVVGAGAAAERAERESRAESMPETRSDADRARAQVRQGDYVPLEHLVIDAQRRFPGRVVEVELEDDVYEIEILMSDGIKVELEYDARSGRLLEVEYDD